MEFFALAIPSVLALLLYVGFKKNVVWWELIIPSATSLLFILVFKLSVKTAMITDTEYWGSVIVEARYYEEWETWVDKTCYRTVSCGKDCTTTVAYDCSYCDENDAKWVAYDNAGHSWNITEAYYNELRRRWNSTPQFVELNRDIDFSGSCGKDGDMYRITWDGKPETSDAAVKTVWYTNKVQASHSAFKLPYVSNKKADSLKLHHYPDITDKYKQRVVLGLEGLYGADSIQYIERLYQYFNGSYGPKNKIKLFVLLFYDRPYEISFKQEAFWDGGNQNELVICIGLNKSTREIQWVRPFSWTDNKRLLVDCREDIAELKTFQPLEILKVLERDVNGSVYKDFKKDFAYLEVDIPTWGMWVIYIVTFLISVGCSIWVIGNEFDNEDDTPRRSGYYRWNHETFGEKIKRRTLLAWAQLKEKYNKDK